MSIKRSFVPALLFLALALGGCGSATSSGGVAGATSSDAAGSPAETSALPSESASASASADASASASADAGGSASASAAASAPAASDGSAGGGEDLAATIPATIGDVEMSVTETDADAYITANVNRQLMPILTALGKTPADVTVATATGAAEGGATLFVDAVRIAGTDAEALLGAFQTAADAMPGSEIETTEVDGKSVVMVTTSSYTLSAYAVGDTIYYVQSPDPELVSQAITALP